MENIYCQGRYPGMVSKVGESCSRLPMIGGYTLFALIISAIILYANYHGIYFDPMLAQ